MDAAAEVASVTDSISKRITTPPRKIRRTDPGEDRVSESGILESLRRFHREETVSGAKMPELRTLSDDPIAVDLNSSDSDQPLTFNKDLKYNISD